MDGNKKGFESATEKEKIVDDKFLENVVGGTSSGELVEPAKIDKGADYGEISTNVSGNNGAIYAKLD